MKRALWCAGISLVLGGATIALVNVLCDVGLFSSAPNSGQQNVFETLVLILVPSILFYFAWAMFIARRLSLLRTNQAGGTGRPLRRVAFAACCNGLLFVSFGLGKDAAEFLHGQSSQHGVFCVPNYFFFMCALVGVLVFALALRTLGSSTFWMAAAYCGSVVALAVAEYGICSLPGWSGVPFAAHNLVYSLILTLIVCAPWLLDSLQWVEARAPK